jgi:leucyl-tRNA---protein transferase
MKTALAARLATELDWYPHQYFVADSVADELMDVLWADGWRHFGTMFFRTAVDELGRREVAIMPLRVDVQAFEPSKSQRRIMRRNKDLRVVVEGVSITPALEALFLRHRERFQDNKPESLYTYFADPHASFPCNALQCCVYEAERLLAVSFFDVGCEAMSSIYAMFEPDAHARSLGIFTMLCEIDFARRAGKRYVYQGYAHDEDDHENERSPYAYKKNFATTEAYKWLQDWTAI